MKILVALKQVPDTETKIKVAADGKSLDATDVKWITSPYDEMAMEEALRIKESRGAEVVAISVGEDRTRELLRNALALGADAAVLIRSAEAGDPLAVARILADFARDKSFDLIFLGHTGFGGDHGAVGPMLAELLGVAQAHVVTRLELGEDTFRAEREAEGGFERIEGSLPAVITAQRGLNEPRYPSLKGIIGAKKKPIEELEAGPIESTIRVSTLTLPPARPEGRKLEGSAAVQAESLIQLLRNEAKVI